MKLGDNSSKYYQLLDPVDVSSCDLTSLEALTDVLPSIVAHNPHYWKQYSKSIITIHFQDEAHQTTTLGNVIRCMNDPCAIPAYILDTFWQIQQDRNASLPVYKVAQPQLFTPRILDGIQHYRREGTDCVVFLLFPPGVDNYKRIRVLLLPLVYDICDKAIKEKQLMTAYFLAESLGNSSRIRDSKDLKVLVDQKLCGNCFEPNSRFTCSNCPMRYCSKQCQKDDWILGHKRLCPTFDTRRYKKILEQVTMQHKIEEIRNEEDVQPPRIICMIASHISSEQRRTYFDELVPTILSQEMTPHRSLISVSRGDGMEWPTRLVDLENAGWEVFRQPARRAQFSHYDFLCKTLGDEKDNNTWVIFSDDDDLWHTSRTKYYYGWINNLRNRYDENRVVSIRPKWWASGLTIEGKVIEKINYDPEDHTRGNEYVHSCMKLTYFRRFMKHCPEEVKDHVFCDVLFSRYIRSLGDDKGITVLGVPMSEDDWIYFYRKGHDDSVCGKLHKGRSREDNIAQNWDYFLALCCGKPPDVADIKREANHMAGGNGLHISVQNGLRKALTSSVLRSSNLKQLYESSLYL